MPGSGPAATMQGGTAQATVPDVCKEPAAPSPIVMAFPNMAELLQALISLCAQKVKVSMMAPLMKDSIIVMSSGDEGGTIGGVISGMFKGAVKVMDGSTKVKCEGRPIANLGSMTGHNGVSANAPMGIILQCGQTKVMIMM